MGVAVGDKVLVFIDKYEGYTAIGKGNLAAVGDKVVLHQDKNGDTTTHGTSTIAVGDKVLVLPEHE